MTEADTIAADPEFKTRAELEEWVLNFLISVSEYGALATTAENAQTLIRGIHAHKDLNDGQD